MADGNTDFLDLILPEVGASRDTWGAKVNQNMQTLDAFLATATPLGVICDFGGTQAPAGWLICDGRLISRVTFSDLFGAIGTTWGAGDGTTTFALPPTPGRSLVGVGSTTDDNGTVITYALAQKSGVTSAAIAQANLPDYLLPVTADGAHGHAGSYADFAGTHNHGGATDVQGTHQHSFTALQSAGVGAGSFSPGFYPGSSLTDAAGAHAHSIGSDGNHYHNVIIPTGGGHSHSIRLAGGGQRLRLVNPTLAVTKIIYAGLQATSRNVVPMGSPPVRRVISAPMRGGIAMRAR